MVKVIRLVYHNTSLKMEHLTDCILGKGNYSEHSEIMLDWFFQFQWDLSTQLS